MSEPLIRFQNLSKRFKRNRVLDAVTLDLEPGERIALIGSNGAGKTTLIRCLLGEYTFDGAVSVDGLGARRERTRVLSTIGFVPQLPPPLKMPVRQLVHFAAAICGSSTGRMFDIARQLGLDVQSIAARPFNRLSGGMKQKLLIAIALGRDTRVLVLDEPAANLDPEARQIFFQLLAGRLENTTMIISSHRLDEVAPLVNRVVEMDMGKIVLDDCVADESSLAALFAVRLIFSRADTAIAKTLEGWNFVAGDDPEATVWTGEVAGPDRLRFFGMLSRYVGLLSRIEMHEAGC